MNSKLQRGRVLTRGMFSIYVAFLELDYSIFLATESIKAFSLEVERIGEKNKLVRE